MLNEDSWDLREDKWKIAWKYPRPQRVCIFIWTTLKQRLITNTERVRKEIGTDPSCPICGHDSEDVLHVLIDCSEAKDIWLNVIWVQLAVEQVADVTEAVLTIA
ncbi:hypothetical protein J1N35_022292 [Gossypium stocksii]|uniref:Reverse transcriptase zinc-binding domain-containing protein n=1 Tax=Gossypium stocksii TaxID=47602 RepID=A0A9D3VGX4_9ROSI|nr:hypothetical protein J1N35_022292 [Gossypium stocksii]